MDAIGEDEAMRLELVAAAALAAAPAPVEPHALYLPLMGGVTVDIAVDPELVTGVNEHEVDVVAIRGTLLTLVDTYRSRPTADGRCTDGQERWIRVIDAAARKERFQRLVHSCRRGLVAAEPYVAWDADGSGFTLTSEPPVRVPWPLQGGGE